jgi:carbon starvation protein CstA
LSVAELFNIDQVKLSSRVLTCAPLIVLVSLLLCWSHQNAKTFNNLWNYFAWGNQFLSVTTLMAATVWLLRAGRRAGALVTLVPGLFMTSVIVAFILWTPGTGGQPWGLVPGGLALSTSTWIAAAVSLLFAVWVVRRGCRSAS